MLAENGGREAGRGSDLGTLGGLAWRPRVLGAVMCLSHPTGPVPWAPVHALAWVRAETRAWS